MTINPQSQGSGLSSHQQIDMYRENSDDLSNMKAVRSRDRGIQGWDQPSNSNHRISSQLRYAQVPHLLLTNLVTGHHPRDHSLPGLNGCLQPDQRKSHQSLSVKPCPRLLP